MEELQSRIRMLENENRLLKERLDESGVSYEDIVSRNGDGSGEAYDPDQGARIKKFEVTDKIANAFFLKFCRGRKDVYDLRHTNPGTGKTGYYTQCSNRWSRDCHREKKDKVLCKDCELQSYKPLNFSLIKAHMIGADPYGNDVIAIYPMLENNLCQLLVFDFDNHAKGAEQEDYANEDDSWKEEVNALRRICRSLNVDAVVERSRSGRGAHLWIFFREMIPAKLARRFGFALLEKGAESIDLKSFKHYDRMIPAQDVLPKGGLGNVIALPLQGQALKNGNSAFADENWNAYRDQLKVLTDTKRLTRQAIEDYLSLWYGADNSGKDDGNDDIPWDRNSRIDANGVKNVVHIVLADRIYIDSSGMSDKVKRQLRRMATFSNKQYFVNQAMDKPNYKESRFIYLGSDEGNFIVLPRGLKEKLLQKFDEAGVRYEIEDKRTDRRRIHDSYKGKLRDSQVPAAEALLA
ncbi:MAG: restriction endonuclease subunit R, partial [Lachnospiraceae bacterium]|nr:restriction endonuclease subunit R [Lachnospiraceae bacterium]